MAPAVRQMLSTEEGHRHFQGARLFFEVGLAREAARHATEADLKALRDALLDATGRRSATASGSRRPTSPSTSSWPRSPAIPIFIALHDQISDWLTEQRDGDVGRQRPGADGLQGAQGDL